VKVVAGLPSSGPVRRPQGPARGVYDRSTPATRLGGAAGQATGQASSMLKGGPTAAVAGAMRDRANVLVMRAGDQFCAPARRPLLAPELVTPRPEPLVSLQRTRTENCPTTATSRLEQHSRRGVRAPGAGRGALEARKAPRARELAWHCQQPLFTDNSSAQHERPRMVWTGHAGGRDKREHMAKAAWCLRFPDISSSAKALEAVPL